MTGPKFDPNDPRLTAYVAGELDDVERAEVERLLEASVEARAFVNDLGDLVAHLEDRLAAEAFEPLPDEFRERVRDVPTARGETFSPVTEPPRDVPARSRTGGATVLAVLVSVVAVCVFAVSLPGPPRAPNRELVTFESNESGKRGHGLAAVSNSVASNGRERDLNENGIVDPAGERIAGREDERGVRSRWRWDPWFFDFADGLQPESSTAEPVTGFEVRAGGQPLAGVASINRNGTSRASVVDNYRASWRGRIPNDENDELALGIAGRGETRTEFLTESSAYGGGGNDEPSNAYGVVSRAIQSEALARNNLALVGETNRRLDEYSRLVEQQRKYVVEAEIDDKARKRVREIGQRISQEREEIGRLQSKLAEVQLAQQEWGITSSKPRFASPPVAENVFLSPVESPVSSFPVRVETWPYASTRELVRNGQLPAPGSVPIECFVNAFYYTSPRPAETKDAVTVTLEAGPCPWNEEHRLVRVALVANDPEADTLRPPGNYVFLFDLEDNTRTKKQLPLLQQGLVLVKERLGEEDRFAIVTNQDEPRVLVEQATAKDRRRILGAIEGIKPGNSTAAAPGLKAAYDNGWSQYVEKGRNEVVVCTDGTNLKQAQQIAQLEKLVKEQSSKGLNTNFVQLGGDADFDDRLDSLARSGNGVACRIERPSDVHDVFVDELLTRGPVVAEDVEVQVEFNPARVRSYRLVGFDDPLHDALTPHEPPANDLVAGGRVTVLYEVRPQPEPLREARTKQVLRYQQQAPLEEDPVERESLSLRLSYRTPTEEEAVEREFTLVDSGADEMPSADFQWAAAVAAYGLVLRDSAFKGDADLDKVTELALGARGPDPTGERREFVELVERTKHTQSKRDAGRPVERPVVAGAEAVSKARVNGRYDELLRTVEVPDEYQPNANFVDYGWWEGTSYAGEHDLPKAHWVYVHPRWYLWGKRTGEQAATSGEVTPQER